MRPCISQATTLGQSFEDDLATYAQAGWTAVEIWLTKLEAFLASHPVAEARSMLDAAGLAPLAAAGQGGLLLSAGEERRAHLALLDRRLEILAALGVPTLVLAADPGGDPTADDYGRAAANLAAVAERARGAGVRIALEFAKTSRFCASLATAVALVEAAGGADAGGPGVCLDLFHFEAGPSKPADLAQLDPARLAWVQASDLPAIPRELAGDADRILPGEGELAIGPILDHLGRIGYDGAVSLEVLNPTLWRVPGSYLADAGLRALVRAIGDRAAAPPAGG